MRRRFEVEDGRGGDVGMGVKSGLDMPEGAMEASEEGRLWRGVTELPMKTSLRRAPGRGTGWCCLAGGGCL